MEFLDRFGNRYLPLVVYFTKSHSIPLKLSTKVQSAGFRFLSTWAEMLREQLLLGSTFAGANSFTWHASPFSLNTNSALRLVAVVEA
jgi:hypothetical protein